MAIKLDSSRFTREFANKSKLIHLIDRAIGNSPEKEWVAEFAPKKGDDGFHPSGDCIPSVYELFHNIKFPEPSKHSVDLKKTFMLGHFWHQYYQHILVDVMEYCNRDQIEVHKTKSWGPKGKLEPYHYVSGSADAIVDVPGHGLHVIDFKTMKGFDFKLSNLPDWAKYKYIAQLNVYMELNDVDQALIICINKDAPHNLKEYTIKRDQDLILSIFDKWEFVSHCLDKNIIITPDMDDDFPLNFNKEMQ